jgi:flagellar biosynthetic protein FliQ
MLSDDAILDAVRTMLVITLKILLPILGVGVVIGLVISILQAVTSIQDQTIAFVPKLVVMIGMILALIPWIVARLGDFAREMFTLS